jgi:hypothetical protein
MRFSRSILLAAAVAALLPVSACTMTPAEETKPLPSLLQPYSQAYHVNAASVVVESRYDPLANPKDVSSTFPIAPDVALKQYAETRFKPAGTDGVFKFVILDASVYQESMDSPSKVARWMNVDEKDRYSAMIKLLLYKEGGSASAPGAMQSQLKAERTLTIPENSSLADRDVALQKFLTDLLHDIDEAAVASLNDTLKLGTGDIAPSPGPWPVEPVQVTPHGFNDSLNGSRMMGSGAPGR